MVWEFKKKTSLVPLFEYSKHKLGYGKGKEETNDNSNALDFVMQTSDWMSKIWAGTSYSLSRILSQAHAYAIY